MPCGNAIGGKGGGKGFDRMVCLGRTGSPSGLWELSVADRLSTCNHPQRCSKNDAECHPMTNADAARGPPEGRCLTRHQETSYRRVL